jgi:hypothetical protein
MSRQLICRQPVFLQNLGYFLTHHTGLNASSPGATADRSNDSGHTAHSTGQAPSYAALRLDELVRCDWQISYTYSDRVEYSVRYGRCDTCRSEFADNLGTERSRVRVKLVDKRHVYVRRDVRVYRNGDAREIFCEPAPECRLIVASLHGGHPPSPDNAANHL